LIKLIQKWDKTLQLFKPIYLWQHIDEVDNLLESLKESNTEIYTVVIPYFRHQEQKLAYKKAFDFQKQKWADAEALAKSKHDMEREQAQQIAVLNKAIQEMRAERVRLRKERKENETKQKMVQTLIRTRGQHSVNDAARNKDPKAWEELESEFCRLGQKNKETSKHDAKKILGALKEDIMRTPVPEKAEGGDADVRKERVFETISAEKREFQAKEKEKENSKENSKDIGTSVKAPKPPGPSNEERKIQPVVGGVPVKPSEWTKEKRELVPSSNPAHKPSPSGEKAIKANEKASNSDSKVSDVENSPNNKAGTRSDGNSEATPTPPAQAKPKPNPPARVVGYAKAPTTALIPAQNVNPTVKKATQESDGKKIAQATPTDNPSVKNSVQPMQKPGVKVIGQQKPDPRVRGNDQHNTRPAAVGEKTSRGGSKSPAPPEQSTAKPSKHFTTTNENHKPIAKISKTATPFRKYSKLTTPAGKIVEWRYVQKDAVEKVTPKPGDVNKKDDQATPSDGKLGNPH